MDDDIVKRLRDLADECDYDGTRSPYWEAADEIERLRQKRAEAEANLAAADGVVVRLRAALERIEEAYFGDIVAADAAHEMLVIARAALAGTAETGSERRNEWKDAIDDGLVCAHIGTADSFPNARAALNALLVWQDGVSRYMATHDGSSLPAEAAPEITQLCPKCTTGWTARELLPCPECGYTFPSRPDDAPETEEMRLLTALVSVRPGCATFDRLMREATAFIAREKLQDDCQHCGGHPGGLDGKGTPCPACGSPGLHRSDCAANNGPALPLGECDCQPMAKAFIEDVRRSRWLDNSHVRCQADCRDECRFPKCRCPLRHTRDCDKTLLPGNDRALCTCGADANNQGREIRVNADGSEYQPPPAPAPEGKL